METLGVGPWIAIVVAVGAVGVLVGYWLGTRLGGHNTEPMRELNREHTAYKEEVREHFEQVSATMTRMVEDYREMYHHVAKGAEKLADMHHETVIAPPPKPEAITQDHPVASDDDKPVTAPAPAADAARGDARNDSRDASRSDSRTDRNLYNPAKASESSTTPASGETSKTTTGQTPASPSGTTRDDARQTADVQGPSAKERPQDAAIRAAAKDAATKR